MDLAQRKCAPCEGGTPPLAEAAARKLAAEVPSWSLAWPQARISREFKFGNFKKAMKFVNQVAGLAEEEGHHPDIHVRYNRVELVLWTHNIGGLSENDFILAAKIDRLA